MANATTPVPVTAVEVELEFRINAPRPRVWQALTQQVERWWPKQFAFSCTGYEDFALHTCVRFSLKEEATCTVLKISDRIWGARAEEAVESHIQGWTWLFEDAFRSFVENPA